MRTLRAFVFAHTLRCLAFTHSSDVKAKRVRAHAARVAIAPSRTNTPDAPITSHRRAVSPRQCSSSR